MKLTTVLLIVFGLHLSARTHSQEVTISVKNAAFEKVLNLVKVQTGFSFFADGNLLSTARPVSLNLKKVPLNEALEEIFKNQLFKYSIDGNVIIIESMPGLSPALDEQHFNAKYPPITGVIRDADGNPLAGVNVVIKGTKKGVTTDAAGKFSIDANDNDVLIISSIGFNVREVKINSINVPLIVALEKSISPLDEVQIIAYGETSKRFNTGNVSTVKAKDIEKQPVNNPLLALQGRVPGLFIEQATGFAGTGVKVRIQGTNSMISGNEPLYVIDGMPFTSQMVGDGNTILGASGNGYGNPLNFINPSDIESIDVLKDADATAIYGSRAANGAILITTKKGKIGEVKTDVNVQSGWAKVGRKLDLMDSRQYIEMREEALKNDGLSSFSSGQYDLNGTWDTTRNEDWQKKLIGGTAKYHDLQASISGGNNITTFLVGAGYHKETNVFPGDFADTKGSVHFSLNSSSSNQRFKIQLSGFYLQDNNLLPQIDLTGAAMTLAPIAPKLYNSDGSLNWELNSSGTTTFYNPMGYLYGKFQNKTSNLISNAVLSYQILKGLEIKSNFGYNRLFSNSVAYQTSEAVEPGFRPYALRSTNFGNSAINSWSIEPQIVYKRKIGGSKLDILIGSTIQQEKRNASSIQASGFSTDQVMEDIKSATALTPLSSVNTFYKYNAVFGRINYTLSEKYIFNFTARRDGSSRFGSKNRFHNFGAIGAAWLISEEKWLKNNPDFISFAKVRASYGTTGNDQIPDYQYFNLYDIIYNGGTPYQGANGYLPNNLTNPYLQWEETKKLQMGLDLGFMKDNILMNVNYFINRSSNQLLYFFLPLTTGFYGIQTNFPATVENKGWEFTLTANTTPSKNFRWTSSINLTIPRNKLVKYPGYEDNNNWVVGQSINVKKKYHFLGVDPELGVYQFANHADGSPTTNPVPLGSENNDAISVINPDPKFYGGFQNTVTYKGFQLDVLFQFTKQLGSDYTLGDNKAAGRYLLGLGNQPVSQLNRWRKVGDIADIQKYTTRANLNDSYYNAYLYSDAIWSDASFVRLKNLSLAWSFPQSLRPAYFRSLKIYAQAQNLLTFTNYKGLDPETKASTSLPPLRVITIGLQLGL